MTKPKTILIRADAGVAIGTGHVMRCLALAQAWKKSGGQVVFATADSPAAIRNRVMQECVEILEITASPGSRDDAEQTLFAACERGASWLVVDGYHFNADYQREIKRGGAKLLFLDDYGHSSPYTADVVLNQNILADASVYCEREPSTRLLLGPKYCLLRNEFASWRNWKREIAPDGRRVLVTMGGSDPRNFTEKVVRCFDALAEDLEVLVVVGSSSERIGQLESMAAASAKKVRILKDVSNMAQLMAWADVAISAAGTTAWELCAMGLPSILIDVAENQTAIAIGLARSGCAIHIPGCEQINERELASRLAELLHSESERSSFTLRCRTIVDGYGSLRVASVMEPRNLRLRPATEGDSHLLWEWANDSQVRAASFSSEPISWNAHIEWFTQKLHEQGCWIWIAEVDEKQPVGQVRVDAQSAEPEIHISVAKGWRGHGLASQLIRQATQSFLESERRNRLHAYIKPDNMASLRAFEKEGFRQAGVRRVRGNEAVHLVYEGN